MRTIFDGNKWRNHVIVITSDSHNIIVVCNKAKQSNRQFIQNLNFFLLPVKPSNFLNKPIGPVLGSVGNSYSLLSMYKLLCTKLYLNIEGNGKLLMLRLLKLDSQTVLSKFECFGLYFKTLQKVYLTNSLHLF